MRGSTERDAKVPFFEVTDERRAVREIQIATLPSR
jgi:hypothetical protein